MARLHDEKYLNWLRGSMSLLFVKECIEAFIDKRVTDFHEHLQEIVSQQPGQQHASVCNTCTHQDIERHNHTWRVRCSSKLCNTWLKQILRFHADGKNPNMVCTNLKPCLWPTNPWEVAKCFLPHGSKTVTAAKDIDVAAILKLMGSCLFMYTFTDRSLVQEVLDIRHRLMHSKNMATTDDQLKCDTDKMIDLLNSLVGLTHGETEVVQITIDNICKLRDKKMDVTLNREVVVLTSKMLAVEAELVTLGVRCNDFDKVRNDQNTTAQDLQSLTNEHKETKTEMDQLKNTKDSFEEFLRKNDLNHDVARLSKRLTVYGERFDLQDERMLQQDKRLDQQDERLGQQDEILDQQNDRIDQQDERLGQQDERLGQQDEKLGQQDEILGQQDDKLGQQDERMLQQDKRLDQQDERLGQQDEILDRQDERIEQQDVKLGQHYERIDQQDEKLGQQTERLDQQAKDMDQQGQRLENHNQRVSVIEENIKLKQSNGICKELLEKNGLVSEDAILSTWFEEQNKICERIRMAPDYGKENYKKVIIYLCHGCTKLMRAIISEQIDKCYNNAEPQHRLRLFLLDKRTTLFHRNRETQLQEGEFEHFLYPGCNDICTDMDQWALKVLAFVAYKTCDIKKEIEELKIIRDELLRTSDRVLSSNKYTECMLALFQLFERILKALTKVETVTDLNLFFHRTEFEVNETVYTDAMTPLNHWYTCDKRQREIRLDHFDEGQEKILKNQDEILQLLRGLSGKDNVKMPETEIVLGLKNCNSEKEREISNVMVPIFNSNVRSDDVLVRELSEIGWQRLSEAVTKVVSELSQRGLTLSNSRHGSIVLRLKSSSYEKLKELWDIAMNGTLTSLFHDIENALQLKYPGVKLEAFIPETEWWRTTTELTETLKNVTRLETFQVQDNEGSMGQNETDASTSCITSAEIDEASRKDPTVMTRVCLKVAPTSEEHLLHIYEVCKNGTLDEKLKDVADALKDVCSANNLEIKVLSDSDNVREKETIQPKEELPTVSQSGGGLRQPTAQVMATPCSRLNDENYLNWLRGSLSLLFLKEGIESFTNKRVIDLHERLQGIVSQKSGHQQAALCNACTFNEVQRHNTTWRVKCSTKTCNTWLKQILRFHADGTNANLALTNLKPQLWPTQPWEIAKCFLPCGSENVNSSKDVDVAAVLKLMRSCLFMYTFMDCSLVQEVLEVCHRLMHSNSMTTSDDQLQRDTDKIIKLLNSMVDLSQEESDSAQKTVDNISKLRDKTLDITDNYEVIVLTSRMNAVEGDLAILKDRCNDRTKTTGDLQSLEAEIDQLNKARDSFEKFLQKNDLDCDVAKLSKRLAEHGHRFDLQNARMDQQDEGLGQQDKRLDERLSIVGERMKNTKDATADRDVGSWEEQCNETDIVIGLKNCNSEKEREISNLLVPLFNSNVRSDDVLMRELSESGMQRLSETVKKVVSEISQRGYTLSSSHHGSIVLRLKSSSYDKLKELWNIAMNGTLTSLFHDVENALQLNCPGVKLEVFIPETEWWRATTELTETLKNVTPLETFQDQGNEGSMGQNEADAPTSCITSAEIIEASNNDPKGMARVCLKVAPTSEEHLLHISEVCKNGTLDEKLKDVADALKDVYCANNLEMKVLSNSDNVREKAETLKNVTRLETFQDQGNEGSMGQNEADAPTSCITSAEIVEASNNDPTGMTRVCLKVAPTSEEHLLHISEVCKNGTLDEKLKDVADALKDVYCANNLEMKVLSDSDNVREKETTQPKEELPTVSHSGRGFRQPTAQVMTTSMTRLHDDDYLNWLRGSMSLLFVKEGIESFIDKKVADFHEHLKEVLSQQPGQLHASLCNTCTHQDIERHNHTWRIQCSSKHIWLKQILRFHADGRNPNMACTNLKPQLRPTNPWEVAKCFQPHGSETVSSAKDINVAAILELMRSCLYIYNFSDRSLVQELRDKIIVVILDKKVVVLITRRQAIETALANLRVRCNDFDKAIHDQNTTAEDLRSLNKEYRKTKADMDKLKSTKNRFEEFLQKNLDLDVVRLSKSLAEYGERFYLQDEKLGQHDERLGQQDEILRQQDERIALLKRINQQVEILVEPSKRLYQHDKIISRLDEKLGQQDERLGQQDERLGQQDEIQRQLGERHGQLGEEIRKLIEKLDQLVERRGQRRSERLGQQDDIQRQLVEKLGQLKSKYQSCWKK